MERGAVDHLLATESPEKVAALLARYNIMPPSAMAKGLESMATELGKEGTPGGQAKILETQAGIGLKRAQTAKEPFMQVPGQGGAVIQLPGVGTGSAVQGPPGGPPGVVYQAPIVQPANPTTVTALGGAEVASNAAQQLKALTANGAMDGFMGPMGRWREAYQQNVPFTREDSRLGALQDYEGTLRTFVDRWQSEGSVRPVEKGDLLAMAPNHRTDKPEAYQAKLDHWVKVIAVINQRNHELLTPGGQMRAGVNADDVMRRYPLPPPAGKVNISNRTGPFAQ